jgi:2-enoate reductase
MKFSKLFEPIQIGKVEVKNRVAMAPMGISGLLNPDGSPGPRAIDYYLERARGGVGLIISSVFKVENDIDSFHGLPFVSPAAISPFAELSAARTAGICLGHSQLLAAKPNLPGA